MYRSDTDPISMKVTFLEVKYSVQLLSWKCSMNGVNVQDLVLTLEKCVHLKLCIITVQL